VVGIDEYHSFTACKGLSDSANNDPPTNFSNMNGIVLTLNMMLKVILFRLILEILTIVINKNPEKVANAERNPYGYTKIPQVPWETRWLYQTCPVGYEQADIYTEDPTFNGFQSKPINSNICLNIHNFRTSRLSSCAQRAQQEMTKTDAPFIFTTVNMKVCCDRQVSITINRSIFPQTRLYIDGKMVGEREQTDLG
ncbi:25147_t:CDS:2, partial [Dentiscutata erythropus]